MLNRIDIDCLVKTMIFKIKIYEFKKKLEIKRNQSP